MKKEKLSLAKLFLFLTVAFVMAFSFSVVSCPVDETDDDADLAVIKELLPAGYPIGWYPGIPGGIPSVTTKSGNTIMPNGTTDMTSTINSAIQTAGNSANKENRLYVELGTGTFTVNGTILLNKSNVVLRGQGSGTIIRGVNKDAGAIVIGAQWNGLGNTWSGNSVNVTANVWAGADSITVADASSFSIGDILIIDRLADNNGSATGTTASTSWRQDRVGGNEWLAPNKGLYDVRGHGSSTGPDSAEWRPVKQYIEVSGKDGNTLKLANKINIDFPSKLSPQVYKTNAKTYQYIGLENMKLEIVAAGNNVENQWEYNPPSILMSMASSYCWVKNVESDGSKTRNGKGFKAKHITMWGLRNTITGCYVHDSYDNRPGGNGYGIEIHGTDGLIENNISDLLCKPILGYASGGGNVIAYNYVPNTETGHYDGGAKIIDWLETGIDTSHQAYSHSDLYEGNYACNISTDNTSGNNGQIVIFRNHAWGKNLKTGKMEVTQNLSALGIAAWNNEHASIGNVWLASAHKKSNAALWNNPTNTSNGGQVVYRIGNFAWGVDWDIKSGLKDGWAMSKFYRHLDYNLIDGKVYKNPASEIETLPKSFYRTSAPDYFAGYTWPPVDPFGTSESARLPGLPAKARYERGGW